MTDRCRPVWTRPSLALAWLILLVVFDYGEAAAIDVFGRPLGLPPAISGHNNYFLWGPRGHDGSVMIVVGGDPQHYADMFGSYDVVGRIDSPYAMPYETNTPIYLLRDLKIPLADRWQELKGYR